VLNFYSQIGDSKSEKYRFFFNQSWAHFKSSQKKPFDVPAAKSRKKKNAPSQRRFETRRPAESFRDGKAGRRQKNNNSAELLFPSPPKTTPRFLKSLLPRRALETEWIRLLLLSRSRALALQRARRSAHHKPVLRTQINRLRPLRRFQGFFHRSVK